jgi:integrase/recombinase XerD
VTRRFVSRTLAGPLATCDPGFEAWLCARGYPRKAVRVKLSQLHRLGRWLEREGLSPEQLTPARLARFLVAQREAGYVTWTSPHAWGLPLAFLQEFGVVPVPTPAHGPLEDLLEGYRRHLLGERGACERTFRRYAPDARLFLTGLQGPAGLEASVWALSPADVSSFLARECERRSVAGASNLVVALRSLLRYLHVVGLIASPLALAVPAAADRRDRSLPRGLERGALARLLASCDRRRMVGRRDYAIILLLARLGIRAGEVAALQLDDVDWCAGEIAVHGKGGRHERLPLPVDVGRALAGYLSRRPGIDCRALFMHVRAPIRPLSANAIGAVVRGACLRAGLPAVGSHRLRHTAATDMLRSGASLTEIAQVLRHRRLETTAIYAKVDRSALRTLARSWPGGGA